MTPIQKKCLDFIIEFIDEFGFSPSYTEIATALGLVSKNSVNRIVCALRDRGYITFIPRKHRSIDLVKRIDLMPAIIAARALVASIVHEHIKHGLKDDDHGAGVVMVDAQAFGELDVKLSEIN